MTSLDSLIVALNALLAAVAVLTCRYGALNDDPRRRPLWGSVAAIALIYACGYTWLLFNPTEVLVWSRLFRGLSVMTWPLVWITPAALITRQHSADIRAVNKAEP